MESRHANSRSSARRLRPRASSSAPTGPAGLCGPAPSTTGRRKPTSEIMQGESLIAGSDVSRGDPRQGAVPAGWAEPGDQSATAQTERKTELLFLKPKKLGAENRSTRSTTPSLRRRTASAPDFIFNFIMTRRGVRLRTAGCLEMPVGAGFSWH